MFVKRMTVLVVVIISLAFAMPVLADAPAEGTVYEGVSVPGIELGSTRAEVFSTYGEQLWCQSSAIPGNNAYCAFPVEGGGQVTVVFRDANGGYATNSPDDVVNHISWSEPVSGWTTTAGVNTALARSNPDAVIAAYPNAVVNYTSWGAVLRVTDYEQGISIIWNRNIYAGTVSIEMSITAPSDPPPPPDPVTRVTGISLYANKIKGKRTIWASVWVDDEYWEDAVGATVIVDWTYPNGSTERLQTVTLDSGVARFEMRNVKSGTHSLEVIDVIYLEHPFDRDYGTLTASIKVK